ncbi:MAG: hypothetical protein FJ303_21405 [Planctomycetes bacterium]|nr:hypothetical protein [Planctomycetota bacterium]
MLRATLILYFGLGLCALVALAQSTEKKTDAKPNDDLKAKSKDVDKTKVEKKPVAKPVWPKDGMTVIDDWLEALTGQPRMYLLTPERHQELLDQIEALKQKPDRKPPSSCHLTGELDGEFLNFSADYGFGTDSPKTTVVLGLKGAFLMEGASLDGETPFLEYDKEDGFLVRVEREGDQLKGHKAQLKFRVPIKMSASLTEREIDLGLPGAASTTLDLRLAPGIKEVRSNNMLEKPDPSGHWHIGLGTGKKVHLAWKEPSTGSGNSPLIKVDGQIHVVVDEKQIHITADLSLEDSQRQTKDWRLVVPPTAEIELTKAPGTLTASFSKPTPKAPYHIMKASDVTADTWKVKVTYHLDRPAADVVRGIGPFHVLDAAVHKGTIVVQMPANVSFGQRLVFRRAENTYQKSADVESIFTYVAPAVSEKTLKSSKTVKAPLELEWRAQSNQLESQVAHELNLRTTAEGWELEATARIQVKALFSSVYSVDLKLPQPRLRGVDVIAGTAPAMAFPGTLCWSGLARILGGNELDVGQDEHAIVDDLGTPLRPSAMDSAGASRVVLGRSQAPKQVTLILKNKMRLPREQLRVRLELPRPIGTQDRGAKIVVRSDKRIELLDVSGDVEQPAPDRHQLDISRDLTSGEIDLAWRPIQREVIARSVIDITLHEHTAQIRQTLRFPREERAPGLEPKPITLKTPAGVGKVTVQPADALMQHDPAQNLLWLRPNTDTDNVDIVLHYDVAIGKAGVLNVPLIWPTTASQKDAKVRVWITSRLTARLTDATISRGAWKERGVEIAPGIDQFPTLVLEGHGSELPLFFKVEEKPAPTLAAFVASRGLIQVRMLDDGSQQVRARYLIRKLQTPDVNVELPISLPRFREKLTFSLGKKQIAPEVVDDAGRIVRLRLHPEAAALPSTLEIAYTVPADAVERTSWWRTTLHAPVFPSEIVVARLHWHLTTTTPMISASLGRVVRSEVQWGWQSWLWTPEPVVNSADLDAWPDLANESGTLTASFSLTSSQLETVYHLPRSWWMLIGSSILVIVVLGPYFSPLPSLAYWLLMLGIGLAVLIASVVFPAAVTPLWFGAQPGAVLCLLFILGHLLIQEQYRRQLIFLPGFTRTKPGLTMVRTKAAQEPREASTVDAPPPVDEQPGATAAGSSS